jgi:anti-sigma regulatory factor (Ser/Thr protein kinase)
MTATDTLRLELDNAETAPATARCAVQAWLADVDCGGVSPEDALLVVSELVTNVVMHAVSESVVVARLDDHRLQIEVHDRDPNVPILMTGTAAGGFGLTIVDSICDAWGWERTDFGKRVWTETLC